MIESESMQLTGNYEVIQKQGSSLCIIYRSRLSIETQQSVQTIFAKLSFCCSLIYLVTSQTEHPAQRLACGETVLNQFTR